MSSTVRSGVVKRDPIEPVKIERFSEGTSPRELAEQLTRLQTNVVEATEAARGRQAKALVFEDVTCGTAGALVVLEHRLGRRARWRVVDWARTTPGGSHGLERAASGLAGATNDDNTLTLVSYVAGTASIEVW